MEEVDKIIIQTLKEMGCDIEENVVSLKQLTAELVVESAVKCLQVIQPGLHFTHSLPPSMSARYKMVANIAEACVDLGYTGEIGYQTFLYSSESDVRKVFLFLLEKLPKETDKASLEHEEESISIRQRFSEALRLQLSTSPSDCPCIQHRFVSVPLETGISLPGQKRDCTPQEWREFCIDRLAFLNHQVSHWSQLYPSIIAHHARCCQGLRSQSLTTPPATSSTSPNSWMNIAASLLYSKESAKEVEKKTGHEDEKGVAVETVSDNKEAEEENLEKLKGQLDQLHLDVKTTASKLSQVISEREKQEALTSEQNKESHLREKTLKLLPDSENNISKLTEVVEDQARTLQRLGTQWERHRLPLVERYRTARRNQSNKACESVRQQETVRQTRHSLRTLKEELTAKEAVHDRLEEEHNKLANTVPRSAYTRRILEIIGNIKKQREEIDKVVEDTKQLKRDINIVADRVDRCFTYGDEIIFRDCKQDNASRKVYKMLMQLDVECRQIVSMIEEAGATVREIRDLEEQIDVEKSKDTASKLDRIKADLQQMKEETASLHKQLARATEPS